MNKIRCEQCREMHEVIQRWRDEKQEVHVLCTTCFDFVKKKGRMFAPVKA